MEVVIYCETKGCWRCGEKSHGFVKNLGDAHICYWCGNETTNYTTVDHHKELAKEGKV